MGKKGLSSETIQNLYDIHNAGLTPYAIADELKISVATVYKYLHDAKLIPNLPSSKKVIKEKELLTDYYNFISMNELCKKYNIKPNYIYQLIRRRNLKARTLTSNAKQTYEQQITQAIQLYKETDLTVYAITLEVGISQPTLHKELRLRNIPFRQPKKAGAKRGKEKKTEGKETKN